MKITNDFLKSKEHCRITPYNFKLRLCGKDGWKICAAFGRGIRTPDIVVGNFKLHEEVLRWMDFLIFNQNEPKNFLPP